MIFIKDSGGRLSIKRIKFHGLSICPGFLVCSPARPASQADTAKYCTWKILNSFDDHQANITWLTNTTAERMDLLSSWRVYIQWKHRHTSKTDCSTSRIVAEGSLNSSSMIIIIIMTSLKYDKCQWNGHIKYLMPFLHYCYRVWRWVYILGPMSLSMNA